jgi:hypothetical protein
MLKELLEIEATIDRITTKLENAMAKATDFKTLVDEINTETDKIAAKIDALVAKLTAGGMNETEEQEVFDQLSAVSDRLKTLGADPADPIPATQSRRIP